MNEDNRQLVDLGYIGQPIVVLDICEDGSFVSTVTLCDKAHCITISVKDLNRITNSTIRSWKLVASVAKEG